MQPFKSLRTGSIGLVCRTAQQQQCVGGGQRATQQEPLCVRTPLFLQDHQLSEVFNAFGNYFDSERLRHRNDGGGKRVVLAALVEVLND